MSTGEPEGKKDKVTLGVMLHKIWTEVARAEQKWRVEQAKRDQQIKRLWGIMQAAFGGALYKLLMDHPSLTDDDKKFLTDMKNVGVERKFQRKLKAD